MENPTPHNPICFLYILSIIGAATYFISKSSGFGSIVLGLLKAIVWPAFLVFGMLKHFNI